MRLFAGIASVGLLVAACTSPSGVSAPSRPTVTVTRTMPSPGAATPGGETAAAVFAPSPNAPLPADARAVAAALERATGAARRSIDAWVASGRTSWPPPSALVLQALYQQRIFRMLAGQSRLAARVFPLLPPSIRVEADAIVHANAAVFAHADPVRPSYRIRTRPPPSPDELLRWYRQAHDRFGVPWTILAAVNYVESKFGRVVSSSAAGAQGPMQFLPSTWAAYGLGGDVHDPHDAILGAANYLHANGAPGNIRAALFHYNPVVAYVDAVTTYASAMRRDRRWFYDLYCWQVYVITTRGDRRVTGPGL